MRVSENLRGFVLVACAGLAGALMAGCGAAAPRASAAPPPASPAEARTELARLELQIDRNRGALGLPGRAGEDAAAKTSGAPSPDPVPGLSFEPPEAPAAKSPPAAVTAADQEESRQEVSACSDNCRLSRAICHAARRICSIASYLGDADAAGRCKRAKQDCRDARKAKPEGCSGCR